MNYDFNKVAVDLGGQEMKEGDKPVILGQMLARQLVNATTGDSLRYYDWAKQLYNLQPINISRSDVKMISDFIAADQSLTNLAKAQLLEILDAGKE